LHIEMKTPSDLINKMAEGLPYKVLTMVREVLGEGNPDHMITRILASALEFTDMERAVLILTEDPPKIFKSATLDDTSVQEIYEISQSALEEASESHKPYVRLNAVSDPYLKGKPSILASRIMSIVCLPLKAGDRFTGVLYLDSREGIETLAKTESVLLEIFASIIGMALNNSLVLEQSLVENESLRASLNLVNFPEIIGKSDSILKVLQTVQNLLPTDLAVLITGETGTGKELIARVLHFSGKRKNGPFLAVNCSALTKTLLESELFGHEKGSFTGAIQQKKGLFEQAKQGTLFLDEVGEMPPSMQAKLLRVLQEGEFRRVGGTETLRTDARVILATNRNLQEMIRHEKFREDLYYRIRGAQIHIPPLRERPQDIALLASHFIKTTASAARKKINGFAPEAMELMKKYGWPGNVRQLKNEVERVVAFAQTEWIRPEDLDDEIKEFERAPAITKGTLKEREKKILLDALRENKWNILRTAKSLGLTRNGLYGKMKLHGIKNQS
jgi:transcriptional regulator with GAF, ATPase, and Fis domain